MVYFYRMKISGTYSAIANTDGRNTTWILVNTSEGKISFCDRDAIVKTWHCSIGKNGTGSADGSGCTPLGIHRVVEKYGHGLPSRAVLKDRVFSGDVIDKTATAANMVQSRIIRLAGCENGINKGNGVDTYQRFVYIHGACREDLVGLPQSHGCITMINSEVIELFDLVSEGMIAAIV